MGARIPEKITMLLAERGLLKRDLAAALGISPQTTTDICKGRSAITLSHLRGLIRFFGLRADYWMDDSRLEPTRADEASSEADRKMRALVETGLLDVEDPARLFDSMRQVVRTHRDEYLRRFGDLSPDERRVLGLPGGGQGMVGRIATGD